MLKLKGITKDYVSGSSVVRALKGVSLEFKENEFVSILGPSGCGKTTLLNIIGGLDQYTYGELLIDGKSTSSFRDSEWDAYRNSTIGFIFQSYNLISHLSVLDNVAIALTLSGVGFEERRKRATEALDKVGLSDQLNKKPNQLSGGQMQRVAIARALVNDPKILLADEPTGALDSKTSEQIIELIKEISKDRLVIMVTHNHELAEQCSDRIIKLLDGEVLEDTRPFEGNTTDAGEKLITQKTAMSFLTALKLSFKNMMTKKWRTIITAFAGSIGIIGIALILAISSGMTGYINNMQRDALAGLPITIEQYSFDLVQISYEPDQSKPVDFPEEETIFSYKAPSMMDLAHENIITNDYLDYLDGMDEDLYNQMTYMYGYSPIVLAHNADTNTYREVSTASSGGLMAALTGGGSSTFSEIPSDRSFVESQYNLIGADSRYPTQANELALVVDKNNRLENSMLEALGITVKESYSFDDFLGHEFKAVKNNDYYSEIEGVFLPAMTTDLPNVYANENNITLKIVGILRLREDVEVLTEVLSPGVVFSHQLTLDMLENALTSDIVEAQKAAGEETCVIYGTSFNEDVTYKAVIQYLGGDDMPTGINIYPKSFDAKERIKEYLDSYNLSKEKAERIIYTDLADMVTSMISGIISTITVVLTAFAAISLVVSSIMIAIITYVSVVERTKEIGILRAIGARKKDISRVFNAETVIIGLTAGIMGVLITLILSIPINIIITAAVGVANIASLPILSALALIGISILLTLISGLIPSRIAAKKDPVVALRTE